MTYRTAVIILLSSLTAFTPSCAGSSGESKGDGDSSGDGDGNIGGDGDGDVGGDGDGDGGTGGYLGDGDGCPPCEAPPDGCTGSGPCGCSPFVCPGDGDAGTGGFESDGDTACERACTAWSECGIISDCVAECEEASAICPDELDAYLTCADGATDIMCVTGVNMGISSGCLTEGTALQTCTASGDGDGDLGTGGINGDGDIIGDGDLGTGGMACPPCAAPPADDCVGIGTCGCGPFICPSEGICGDAVCENGDVCCNALQGICAPPNVACIQ